LVLPILVLDLIEKETVEEGTEVEAPVEEKPEEPSRRFQEELCQHLVPEVLREPI